METKLYGIGAFSEGKIGLFWKHRCIAISVDKLYRLRDMPILRPSPEGWTAFAFGLKLVKERTQDSYRVTWYFGLQIG